MTLSLLDGVGIILATSIHGPGVYNHLSASIGYASINWRLSIGPSMAAYSTPACGQKMCGRLSGVSPGLIVAIEYYVAEWFGVSANLTADWLTGSPVLPAGLATTILLGPVLKWSRK